MTRAGPAIRLCVFIGLLGSAPVSASAAPFAVYISPQGNDSWSGRLADPVASDGPFATLQRGGMKFGN